ncbi:MAG: hypothetical protein ACM37V_04925 [Gemmatimonadota bacterium]
MRTTVWLALVSLASPLAARAGGVPTWAERYMVEYSAGTAGKAAGAIPSFSRQTGLACNVCHIAFPQLTAFGRLFKLNGYTLTGLQTVNTGEESPSLKINLIPPVSAMAMTSMTQTSKAQPGTQNGNVEFPQQLSVFLGEEITPRMGTFIQVTYEAAEGALALDNVDVRYANHAEFASHEMIYGFTLNNNPTVQDVWNSTPAWGFPFASSSVAPTPAAATLIDGGLGQAVAGLGAYAFWNNLLYGEVSAYRSAQQGGPHPPDATSSGITKGIAPYWRLALQHTWGSQTLEVGTFGMSTRLFPSGVTGPTDRFTDVALDAQYERRLGSGNLFAHAAWINEKQHLDATFGAGGSSNATNSLHTFRVDATALTASRLGGSLGFFNTSGDADATLYGGSANGSPNSSGIIAEAQYMPWLNTRFEAQYVVYSKFDGASSNYDGSGRNASDNNTLYLMVWLVF